MNFIRDTKCQKGYSLIELTVATGILCLGIAAAASLSMTSTKLEEMSQQKSRAVAIHEAAARMWQLGLNEATIEDLLLSDPSVDGSAGFTTANRYPKLGSSGADYTEIGQFEEAAISLSVTADGGVTSQQLNTLNVYRK